MSIKVGKTNKNSLFSQNKWEKVWNLIGEPLSLHRVFHSIRFKVNKVGIQRYPIFCVHMRITLLFVFDVPLPYKYIGVDNRGKSEKSAKNCRIHFEYPLFWEIDFQFRLIWRYFSYQISLRATIKSIMEDFLARTHVTHARNTGVFIFLLSQVSQRWETISLYPAQNDTLFSTKRHVVFSKMTRCFRQNDTLFLGMRKCCQLHLLWHLWQQKNKTPVVREREREERRRRKEGRKRKKKEKWIKSFCKCHNKKTSLRD